MQDTHSPKFTPEQLEVRRKWREALRSGKYAQTQGILKDESGFCCLGVLCDMIEPSGWTTLDSSSPINFRHRGQGGLPHTAIRNTAGIADVFYFADMNDSLGLSFPLIADAIEGEERGEYVEGAGSK